MKNNLKKMTVLVTLLLAIFSFGVYLLFNFYFFEYTNEAEIINNKVDILSKINGKVAELNAEENAEVNEGEILVQFDSEEYVNAIVEAEKKLEELQAKENGNNKALSDRLKYLRQEEKNAKMKLEDANSDYVRYKNAFKDGSVTKNDIDKAVKNLETAKNKYVLAQNNLKSEEGKYNSLINEKNSKNSEINELTVQLDELKQDLLEITIIAPVSGVIRNKNIQIGEEIKAGNRLFTIMPKEVFVDAKFKENQASKIQSGQKAKIKIGNKKLNGIVENVDNSIAKIKIVSENIDFSDDLKVTVKVKVK